MRYSFAGFWTTPKSDEEEEAATSSSWFFSGVEKINLIPPKASNVMDQKEETDLRHVLRIKAEKHKKYFRSLIESAVVEAPKATPLVLERHRRQGVYQRNALEFETHGPAGCQNVTKLREEYLEMVEKSDGEKSEHLLVPPQNDCCTTSSSGVSDEERNDETNWHRKHKVTRCGSSDSAMGQSDDDPQEFSSASNLYSSKASLVPSKTIIESQTVIYPFDRKCSMECTSEEPDFYTISRRQSCFTDDGDDGSKYRCWRTPSVVVSDYSDDIVGLTLEDVEYIRNHNKETSSSPESSLHSSCSNLNYCGSTISGLESEFVLTKPYRKSSNCSTCSTVSGDEELDFSGDSRLKPRRKYREVSSYYVNRNNTHCNLLCVRNCFDAHIDT